MKTTLIIAALVFLTACSHTPDDHREERIEGVMHDHEIWEDPKTHLQWTRVPVREKKFAQAQKVCAQRLEDKLERFDLGMAKQWRMPAQAEIIEAKKRGLRHAFNTRHFWIKDAYVYDRVADRFQRLKPKDEGFDVLCVARRDQM